MERRNANYNLLKSLKAFEPVEGELLENTCGNIQDQFNPTYYREKNPGIFGKGVAFYDAVSAPMLLARLCAGFSGLHIFARGQEAYKVTWQVILRYKESGHIVTFYDWKGSASFGSDLSGELPAKFKRDVQSLLLALVDETFPHPYDGCKVGEVA